mmetsp:Transcript_11134/g.17213  ORF Transcript_11134/g.17213 Transcript_11134/m.17213 type:complete len:102 (-) Transcript_11134:207-512(-)
MRPNKASTSGPHIPTPKQNARRTLYLGGGFTMSILRICPRPAHAAQQIRPRGRLSDDFAEPPALPPSKRHHMRHEKEMHRRAKSTCHACTSITQGQCSSYS